MAAVTPVNNSLRVLAATSALVLLHAGSAYAVDGNVVAARLKSVYAEQGGVIEYSNVETNGSTVILKDTKMSSVGIDDKFNAGDITLSDVTDVSGGGFKIGALAIPDIEHTTPGEHPSKIAIEGIKLEDITLPAEGSTEPFAKFLQYERAEIAHVSVNADGKDFFTADRITATISPLVEKEPIAFTTIIDTFKLDLTDVSDPKAKDALKTMGYETISGKVDLGGTWNMADGRLNIEKMDYIVDNGGTLGVKLDISGYTLDFVKSIQEASKNAEGKPDDAQAMAMMGLMQQLNFNNASIRFDDNSVTGKALDYVAKQQNAKRSDLVNQAKAILPMAAAQLGDAEFAQAVGTAVSAYLDDPKNIEIKAAPAKPVPFAILAAAGMADPKSLIKTLSVTVDANK
ncbi:hypothetical protein OSJ77_09520 [Phyllobacterium sp. 0TCS1.6C]|uniref:hypothetical protein n=1 Tax=unclassified Phyllobacterium TaxID=2638441 RepID=UPI002264B73C|nr:MULTISPECIES: hypothetical protein [unclassified Phyllobacterium]MCX8280430.1 hypothetical protein [Phyllobacterium sp. 0TCS1.6C]MCX8295121.1 hypothetical protein [Phyllobacterium sp. 0TCS1.6A]